MTKRDDLFFELVALLKNIRRFGDLGCVQISDGFGYGSSGKKPPSKDVWQFPRHMLTDIDALLIQCEPEENKDSPSSPPTETTS